MTTGVRTPAPTGPKMEQNAATDSGHDSTSVTPDSDRATSPGDGTNPTPEAAIKLKIQCSTTETFELTVNNAEIVQEIHQVLLEKESTCHRTCFSLHINGQPIDTFTELRNVPGLVDGSTLQVVEEPYTVREARIHLRHIRELLRGQDLADYCNGIDGASVTFLSTINMQEQNKGKETKPFEALPPDHVLPGVKERSLSHMLPSITSGPQAIKNLGISPWNPPNGPRKLRGDVLYLYVDTMEKRRLHITCCTKGFYVNASTDDVFNPAQNPSNKIIYHSIVDLLIASSSVFKKAYITLIKKRFDRHVMERLPTPYPVYSWVTCDKSTTEDSLRADEFTQPHRVGFEDHLPGQVRDWNEELQATYELARGTLTERVVRDRSVFKIHGDFVGAAIKGASNVMDGNVMAINPADDPKTHMYIWNNIFFSLGFDVKDHYKELGGDSAAFVAVSADLQGVKAYSALDLPKLRTLGMAIIDYKGYRVTAQSIIPGILEREQEQSVVYGSIDFGKTVVANETYHEILDEAARSLRILPHEVLTGEGENEKKVKLFTSFETKGIVGNDSRYYVLDLLRTMPPDVHFLEGATVSEAATQAGFPRPFPHKLASLRQELIEFFYESRCMKFIRSVASYVRQNATEDKTETEALEKEMGRIFLELSEGREATSEIPLLKTAIIKAAAEVNSMSEDRLDIRFNPDCYASTVRHASEEDLEKQRALVCEAAEFILTSQLPAVCNEILDESIKPIDGVGLVEHMHSRGVNVRYLGEILKKFNDSNSYVRPLVVVELLCRCIKHVFRPLLYSVPQEQLAQAVAHLLNSVFGHGSQENGFQTNESKSSKKSGKKTKKSSCEWATVTPKSLWKSIVDEASKYYGYNLETESIDELITRHGFQKVSLLRRICHTMGIQLLNKEFVFDVKSKAVFTENDIYGLFPITKHRNPAASDAKKLFQRGQQAINCGQVREAFEYIAESVNFATSVYGALHPELSIGLRSLARLSYILGDNSEALSQQHKATLISERTNGIDHSTTIQEYIHLAHYAFGNLFITAAVRLLYRARYLLLIAHGERHPIMTQIDGNIGVILFATQEYDTAIKYLQLATDGSNKKEDAVRLRDALLSHMLARCHAARGDYRAALHAEKETYSVYNQMFGADHEKTKESSETLKILTQQAVSFQKTMNDPSKVTSLAHLIPLQQPSLTSILEILNIINGFIYVYSPALEEKQNSETQAKLADEALD